MPNVCNKLETARKFNVTTFKRNIFSKQRLFNCIYQRLQNTFYLKKQSDMLANATLCK